MRQVTAYEKELNLKEKENRRNSPILASIPADKTHEDKQLRESVEEYLRTFDLIAIPSCVIKNWKKEFQSV